MEVAVAGTCILICCVGFASLAVAVVAFGVHDMMTASRRMRFNPIRDPWTRLLDDALRRNPDLPRLREAIRELRWRYAEIWRQRAVLVNVLSAHQRLPGDNTQASFLQRQLEVQEEQLEAVRKRVRELHALVVVRGTREQSSLMPITDGVVGRLQAELEVEHMRHVAAPARIEADAEWSNTSGEFALL